jgi:transposase
MEMDERGKKLKLWVRRKKAELKLICSHCWKHMAASTIHAVAQQGSLQQAFQRGGGTGWRECSGAPSGARMGLAESTVRAIDMRYLERWEASRRRPPLRQIGVDEIYRGKQGKFLTVVCNLETAEPLWFGPERKKETLDDFFRSQLVSRQRKRIEAACVDMGVPFRLSLEEWAPQCQIVYDKFHILQHANDAIDEVRRAEFFRQGKRRALWDVPECDRPGRGEVEPGR